MSDFPTVLTGAIDGVPGVGTPIVAKHLNNLEGKVGIDQSAVATSLDYLIKSAGGWVPFPAAFTYASADTPTFTFTIPGDQTGLLSPGMRIRLTQTTVKYFIITAVSYSSPNTTVTVYGGTDYTLANAAITNPYFSPMKAPFGFPLDPSKWTVEVIDLTGGVESSPVPGTWYNLGSIAISVPIGIWNIVYEVCAFMAGATDITQIVAQTTLSTSNSDESDQNFTCIFNLIGYTSGTAIDFSQMVRRRRTVNLVSKTSFYLLMKTLLDGIDNMDFVSTFSPTIITAVCAYL